MLFIGQVVIEAPLFPIETARVAYIFMTEVTDETCGTLETWDPRSGENAVVIQQTSAARRVTISEGPHLMQTYWVDRVSMKRPLELAADVTIDQVLPKVPSDVVSQWEPDRQKEYYTAIGQKIGGTPDWIQADESPEGWRLLLQLPDYPRVGGDSIQTSWNFGSGRCYVLISPDCSEGLVLWQC